MKHFHYLLFLFFIICSVPACKNTHNSTSSNSGGRTENLVALPFNLDSLPISGEPFYLTEQKLTGIEVIENLKPESNKNDAFFYSLPDIKETPLTKAVRLRYNYATVLNLTMHHYELFAREANNEEYPTHQDTLNLIKKYTFNVPTAVLRRSIPLKWASREAEELIQGFALFNGRDDSPFYDQLNQASMDYLNLPVIASEELLDDFKKHFWQWYDKRRYVPEYDEIASMYLEEKCKQDITDEQIEHLRIATLAEKDINRRTILALELLRMRSALGEAAIILGDILESGIYTKYIVEAWIAWRAAVQLDLISPSSYSLIPNAYYDKIRVICLNTILMHAQETDDKYASCLLENLICCQLLHRNGSIYGNESLSVLANLNNHMFIQPSALGYDYLNE